MTIGTGSSNHQSKPVCKDATAEPPSEVLTNMARSRLCPLAPTTAYVARCPPAGAKRRCWCIDSLHSSS
jgi:hypothetical protein